MHARRWMLALGLLALTGCGDDGAEGEASDTSEAGDADQTEDAEGPPPLRTMWLGERPTADRFEMREPDDRRELQLTNDGVDPREVYVSWNGPGWVRCEAQQGITGTSVVFGVRPQVYDATFTLGAGESLTVTCAVCQEGQEECWAPITWPPGVDDREECTPEIGDIVGCDWAAEPIFGTCGLIDIQTGSDPSSTCYPIYTPH